MTEIGQDHGGKTQAQIALNWVIAKGALPIPGAKTGDQAHPVFALVRRSVKKNLEDFLSGGGRKIDAWYASLKVIEVPFDDEADAFRNINTREELNSA